MDQMHLPLVTHRGQQFDEIEVFVDILTGQTHIAPGISTMTASDFADVWMNNVYRFHGVPDKVISDQDPLFISKFWEAVTSSLGIRLARSASYHPQTDGMTERMNRTILDTLRCLIPHLPSNWVAILPAVEFALNENRGL